MKKYIFSILIVLVVIGVIIAIILTNNNDVTYTNEVENKITKVTLSEVTRSVFYAPQYAAISNGFFEEENIEIDLTTGQGADTVMTAVLAGQCDIGFARPRSYNICI